MNIEITCDREAMATWAIASLKDPLSLSLSRAILDEIDFDSARFSIFASEQPSKSACADFDHGGKTDSTPSPDQMLVEKLQKCKDAKFVVLEDWMARPGDKFLVDKGLPFKIVGNEVFYVFDMEEVRAHPAWRRACANYAPLFHGFVFDELPSNFDSRSIARNQRLVAAFFGIFDGESYLFVEW